MAIEVKDCIAGIEKLSENLDSTMHRITKRALETIQVAGASFAPVGTPGNTTNPPGDLKRSIDVEGPRGGDGLYGGEVGPTVIYGRQRELGGHLYAKRARYMRFVKWGVVYYRKHVYQFPHPYMKPGRTVSIEPIWVMANKQIAGTIKGSEAEHV